MNGISGPPLKFEDVRPATKISNELVADSENHPDRIVTVVNTTSGSPHSGSLTVHPTELVHVTVTGGVFAGERSGWFVDGHGSDRDPAVGCLLNLHGDVFATGFSVMHAGQFRDREGVTGREDRC